MLINHEVVDGKRVRLLTINECYMLVNKPTKYIIKYIIANCIDKKYIGGRNSIFWLVKAVIHVYFQSILFLLAVFPDKQQSILLLQSMREIEHSFGTDDQMIMFIARVFPNINILDLYNQSFKTVLKLVKMAEAIGGKPVITNSIRKNIVG